jgi:hypothetical protein
MQNIKYVRIGDNIVMFPASMGHDDVAKAFGGKDNVVSAGFVSVAPDCDDPGEVQVKTYGESHTLQKKPDPRDDRLLRMMFRAYM